MKGIENKNIDNTSSSKATITERIIYPQFFIPKLYGLPKHDAYFEPFSRMYFV